MRKLQESGENYLENILILEKRIGSVRSVDLAREMGFSKPSVSRAIHLLKDQGYLQIEDNGHLILTEDGRAVAEMIYDRHIFITEYLMGLGVPEEIAAEDACRIEHVISQESFDKLRDHVTYCTYKCPAAHSDKRFFDFNVRRYIEESPNPAEILVEAEEQN
ncbi:MAG: metal-dependent transcriptional regulator [Eubacteriales bacterium]|nr:metal-dependent transcriptional regulator [Eubacteriales bacterium]